MSSSVSQKKQMCVAGDIGTVRRSLRSVPDLIAAGFLSEVEDISPYIKLSRRYDIGISEHVRGLIEQSENAAIARQYVPSVEELNILSDEENDPICDEIYAPVNGIVHRYPDRVLFKIVNVCGVYCRYCFRREMIGAGSSQLSEEDFEQAIEYIKTHKEIWEVILTGGDPLILSSRRLLKIFDALSDIEHVKIIRIHTRIPISDPLKIDDTTISVLKNVCKPIHVVAHINHVKEITESVESKILAIREANCSVFSQSVLLKGVNDNAEILEKLFRKLVCIHVKPYYLHHMDRANGTSHFRVSIEEGKKIMKDLQGRVSGICLPKYMLDIPGGHGKIPISDSYVIASDRGVYSVEDYQGCKHLYFDKRIDKK